MQIALKIDVDTLRGSLAGIPRLLETLRYFNAGATFLFSLGPDHTGRAIRRVFRRGFLGKVARTSVLRHYGVKTLLYGTLLPGPDIGIRAEPVLRSVRDAGFETGVHCWDHCLWQDHVVGQSVEWTNRQIDLAHRRYQQIFGSAARVCGAAGWQMNSHAYLAETRLDLAYASDSRGTGPYIPVVDGYEVAVPQLPTTLPTMDELIGREGWTEHTVERPLHALTGSAHKAGRCHVFTLHAELEGMALEASLRRLLAGWLDQGWSLVSMQKIAGSLDRDTLPRCVAATGEVAGRSGTLAIQGESIASESLHA